MGGFGNLGDGGRVWRRPQRVNLGRKWVEAEDEGNSSCEKLRVVLAALLVVAVYQNTPLEINIHVKVQKTRISDLQNIFGPSDPSSGKPPRVGGYRTPDQPLVVATVFIVWLAM